MLIPVLILNIVSWALLIGLVACVLHNMRRVIQARIELDLYRQG